MPENTGTIFTPDMKPTTPYNPDAERARQNAAFERKQMLNRLSGSQTPTYPPAPKLNRLEIRK